MGDNDADAGLVLRRTILNTSASSLRDLDHSSNPSTLNQYPFILSSKSQDEKSKPFRFGISAANTHGPNVTDGSSSNSLKSLLNLQKSAVESMSSKDMKALLMMKKRKEEEEDLRKQLELSTFSKTDLFSSFNNNDAIKLGLGMDPHSHMSMMMEQQMQMTMQIQRKMMMQAKMLSEEQKKIEDRRKFDDLHLSINN